MASELNKRIAISKYIRQLAEELGISENAIFDTVVCVRENLERIKSLVSGDKVQSDFEYLIMKQLYSNSSDAPVNEEKLFAREKLLAKLGGKQETMLRIIRQFVTGHSDSCALIIEHLKTNDFMSARSVMHDVIGLTGNLCCDLLYSASGELRAELHAEKSDSLESFRQLWNETLDVMDIYLRINDKDDNAPVSEKPFKKVWERFIGLCGEYDIQSNDYFDKHRSEFAAVFSEKEFEKIEEALNRYDLGWIAENVKYTGE